MGIGPTGEGGFGLSAELHVRLPDLDATTAREIVDEADRVCPYSNAIRGNIDVVVSLDPAAEVI